MRTKTLFLAAAALAAGLASSMAQSNVYSVNIVGYINQVIPGNVNTLIGNPLDNGTNDLNSLGAGLALHSTVQVWGGTSFITFTKTSSGWTIGSTATNYILPPGTGFFAKQFGATATTNLFIGSASTTTNTVLPSNINTLSVPKIPFSGTLTDAGPNTLNLAGLPAHSTVQVWFGSSFGTFTRTTGGWAVGSTATNINIGLNQGFFVKSFGASTWQQSIQ